MTQGLDKIEKCDNKIKKLAEWLESYANKLGSELIISSGKREGTGSSWHDQGKAIDFYFKDSNVFKHVTPLYFECYNQKDVFLGVTEFEVCRGVVKKEGKYYQWQHLHVAFGDESSLETFTGIYK